MRLIADDLTVHRGERPIFTGLSFAVSAGEALVVTGPNGAGKSTLLRSIAGFLNTTSGRLVLEGGDQEATIAEQCHYLGHDNAMKPALTVAENLNFWQRYLGPGTNVDDALEKVGLPGIEELPVGYLSAGQKRRVAIARLLVTYRPVWLADEPTTALDKASQAQFANLVEAHLTDGGIVVAATHKALGLIREKSLEMLPLVAPPSDKELFA